MAPTAPKVHSKLSFNWGGRVLQKGSCISLINPLAAPALMMRRTREFGSKREDMFNGGKMKVN
jgi:hypothetical protein